MTKKEIEKLNEYDEKCGVPSELICMEECAELIQAISKVSRTAAMNNYDDCNKAFNNLIEEMADVTICLKKLEVLYKISNTDIEAWIEKKMERNLKRCEEKL